MEDLLAKYQPFCVSWLYSVAITIYCHFMQDQLEALDVLKSESSFARAEVSNIILSVYDHNVWCIQFLRVSADYAKLLGHQNPKQKIHYVSKLKDENVTLKQVLFMLRLYHIKIDGTHDLYHSICVCMFTHDIDL